jgi:hypothetical protein
MQEITFFHEDVFYEYFRPFRHPATRFNTWGGHGLETFGEDLQLVRDYDQNYVWTVVEGGEGVDEWITPGFHYVNRICYLLTEIPHNDAPVEFRTARNAHSLTPLGLARRISTLRRIMSTNK